jgi:hypothetical protein
MYQKHTDTFKFNRIKFLNIWLGFLYDALNNGFTW